MRSAYYFARRAKHFNCRLLVYCFADVDLSDDRRCSGFLFLTRTVAGKRRSAVHRGKINPITV